MPPGVSHPDCTTSSFFRVNAAKEVMSWHPSIMTVNVRFEHRSRRRRRHRRCRRRPRTSIPSPFRRGGIFILPGDKSRSVSSRLVPPRKDVTRIISVHPGSYITFFINTSHSIVGRATSAGTRTVSWGRRDVTKLQTSPGTTGCSFLFRPYIGYTPQCTVLMLRVTFGTR